jgi:hemolysin III
MRTSTIDDPRRGWHARDPVSGYSHLAGLVFAAIGLLALVVLARTPAALATSVAYGVSLVALYAASSAYHLVPGDEALTKRLRKLDHSAIFLMIAGSSTPIFWRAFDGASLAWMLGGIWALALVGILFRVLWMSAPRALYTIMYVAMGWLFVARGPDGFRALPSSVVALVVAGGLTYTAGAVVYALKRPNPFPRVFGFHEIWHLFVLGGSALHYVAMLILALG